MARYLFIYVLVLVCILISYGYETQPWWSYFATHAKADGDGRPISLTLWKVARGVVKNFRIISPPFWSNTVAESTGVVYDGMYVNATNTDPLYIGKKWVLFF